MATGFVLDPLGEKLTIGQLPAIGNLGGGLGLAGVETEKCGYGGDHVGHGETVGASGHDVGAVEFYGCEGDAAMLLANAGLDQGANEGLDGAAGWAPRCGPQRQQRDTRGRRYGEICLESVIVADSVRGVAWSDESGTRRRRRRAVRAEGC